MNNHKLTVLEGLKKQKKKTKSGVRWVMGSYVMGDNDYLKLVVGALSEAIMVSVSQILLGSADSQVMN